MKKSLSLLEKFEANEDLMTLLIAYKRGKYKPVNQKLREVLEWLKTNYQMRFVHGTAEYRRVQAKIQLRKAKAECCKNLLKLREDQLEHAIRSKSQKAIEKAKLKLAKCRGQQENVQEESLLRNEMMEEEMPICNLDDESSDSDIEILEDSENDYSEDDIICLEN